LGSNDEQFLEAVVVVGGMAWGMVCGGLHPFRWVCVAKEVGGVVVGRWVKVGVGCGWWG
jgi:hypothetical protein